MRLGIMQPYFFPYIGYFSLIKNVDKFILLDDVQFIRHGWIERNRILKQTGGWQYIAVPLKKHSQSTKIKDIEINNSIDWKSKIFAQLDHYKKAPYYKSVINLIYNVFEKDYYSISDLNLVCLQEICNYLNIETPIEIFRNMGIKIDKTCASDEWALNICKAFPTVNEYWNPIGGRDFFNRDKYSANGIDLKFHKVDIIEYSQKKDKFEEALSIIDIIMFNDVETTNKMMERYILYE